MRRHELSDEHWELVKPLLCPPRPRKSKAGRPPRDPRVMLNGALWILATGAPWRDLPERFGPWQSVYGRYSRWRKAGVFAKIVDTLQIRLDEQGLIDWELWCVDGANVRASRAAAGADKKASSATPTSRGTMRWAARGAGLDRSSMWSLTARELRWRSK